MPYEVLTKHAAEGFRYVGRFRGVSDPTDDNTVTPEQLKANLAASAANPRARALPGFVRFTSDGDVYVMTKRVELPRVRGSATLFFGCGAAHARAPELCLAHCLPGIQCQAR